jgi:hypothetical protein
MPWCSPRCGGCWFYSLGAWDAVTFYTRLMALSRTQSCTDTGGGTRRIRQMVLLCIIPWWSHRRGHPPRPSIHGGQSRRLVALLGQRGPHVHTSGRERPHGNPTCPSTTIFRPHLEVLSLALPNSTYPAQWYRQHVSSPGRTRFCSCSIGEVAQRSFLPELSRWRRDHFSADPE